MNHTWTRGEMLAVAASHLISDEDVSLVGLGIPQIAALLAKRTHAPETALLLELGVYEPRGAGAAMGVADPRIWEGSAAFGSMVDVLGAMLQGGRVTLGLLGALQVDVAGNINSTLVRVGNERRRFLGSGGANDIATHAGRTMVIMRHQPRKFLNAVDFVTSPGRKVDGKPRSELGIAGEGSAWVVTDRAVFAVTDDGLLLESVHPSEAVEGVLADTPVEVLLPEGGPTCTPEPTAEELGLIRTELDPEQWYTR